MPVHPIYDSDRRSRVSADAAVLGCDARLQHGARRVELQDLAVVCAYVLAVLRWVCGRRMRKRRDAAISRMAAAEARQVVVTATSR